MIVAITRLYEHPDATRTPGWVRVRRQSFESSTAHPPQTHRPYVIDDCGPGGARAQTRRRWRLSHAPLSPCGAAGRKQRTDRPGVLGHGNAGSAGIVVAYGVPLQRRWVGSV